MHTVHFKEVPSIIYLLRLYSSVTQSLEDVLMRLLIVFLFAVLPISAAFAPDNPGRSVADQCSVLGRVSPPSGRAAEPATPPVVPWEKATTPLHKPVEEAQAKAKAREIVSYRHKEFPLMFEADSWGVRDQRQEMLQYLIQRGFLRGVEDMPRSIGTNPRQGVTDLQFQEWLIGSYVQALFENQGKLRETAKKPKNAAEAQKAKEEIFAAIQKAYGNRPMGDFDPEQRATVIRGAIAEAAALMARRNTAARWLNHLPIYLYQVKDRAKAIEDWDKERGNHPRSFDDSYHQAQDGVDAVTAFVPSHIRRNVMNWAYGKADEFARENPSRVPLNREPDPPPAQFVDAFGTPSSIRDAVAREHRLNPEFMKWLWERFELDNGWGRIPPLMSMAERGDYEFLQDGSQQRRRR